VKVLFTVPEQGSYVQPVSGIVGWSPTTKTCRLRYPTEPSWGREKWHLFSLVLGVGGCVQGKRLTRGTTIDLSPEQHAIRSSGVAHDATKRRWAPQTTRDTPKGVQNPSINGTEVVSAVFYLTAIMSLKIL